MVTEPMSGSRRALYPDPSSVMPLNPEGPFPSCGSLPTSDIRKQTGSPETGEASLGLRPKPVPAPSPPLRTESRLQVPELLQCSMVEGWG